MANSAWSGNTAGLASATSAGLVGTGAQTFAGKKTLDGGGLIKADSVGTTIPAGYIGYQVRGSRAQASAVTLTTVTYVDVVSGGISLGVGTWDITAIVGFNYPTTAPTGTFSLATIGTVAGNDSTGSIQGDNRVAIPMVCNSNSDVVLTIPQYRVTITTGTQTFYLKAYATFSAGTMSAYGRISAVLVG